MKTNILIFTVILCLPTANVFAKDAQKSNNASCYSTYHLQQELDMSVQFGENLSHQKTKVDIDIHVKETPTANKYLNFVKNNKGEGKWSYLRSYIVWINPNKDKGIYTKSREHYRHPFMAIVNGQSGEILELETTAKDKDTIIEYMSLFDLFQYTKKTGEHRYRNGNGYYTGKIVKDIKRPGQIIKSNQGYLNAENEVKKGLKIIESTLNIDLAKDITSTISIDDCFYQKAKGTEKFTSTLSAQSIISGNSKYSIASDRKRQLDQNHFFFTLTSDLNGWPSFVADKLITKDLAMSKLPGIVLSLKTFVEDEAGFLEAMLANKEVWPYLADYIQETGISNALSLQLFWSLDRIDSPASVDALAILATATLNTRDHFRSVMALGSTNAPLSDNSINLLHEKLESLTSLDKVDDHRLTFVRTLGSIAKYRDETDPLQSQKLKDILYTQVRSSNEKTNTAVIDAIGNLGSSIDDEGIEILMNGTTEESKEIRLSSTDAFTRIPYKPEYSEKFISQLAEEDSIEVKSKIVKVLGKTDNSDIKVKQQLLSVVKNARDTNYEKQSLKSLKKINYSFKDSDIKILANKLRGENDKNNQRLLASLILKHKRK